MKFWIYAAAGIFFTMGLTGCVTIDTGDPDRDIPKTEPVRRAFISLRQIHAGMTPQEVRAVLGDKIVVGYDLLGPDTDQYRPVTRDNPYRSETFEGKNGVYLVEYYIMGVQTPDGQITDDELIPLVFENGRLKGSGWTYLQKTRP